MKESMANYCLVHGAWRGGWVWKRVARQLRKEGHDLYTPTMIGLGERSHLLNGAINLSTCIQDIVNVIKFEELNDVILCGHSFAGMVITGVADMISEQIAALVYLDAVVPEDGTRFLRSYLNLSSFPGSRMWRDMEVIAFVQFRQRYSG
jgi:pimeloyl-ACP methyl ester carboxylesterase